MCANDLAWIDGYTITILLGNTAISFSVCSLIWQHFACEMLSVVDVVSLLECVWKPKPPFQMQQMDSRQVCSTRVFV